MQTPVASSFKLAAYALILLQKDGNPCIFYGDMYGLNVDGSMVPACDGKLPIMAQARKHYAYGEQENYFDEPNCVGSFLLALVSLSWWLIQRQGSCATETLITLVWRALSVTAAQAKNACSLVDDIRTHNG